MLIIHNSDLERANNVTYMTKFLLRTYNKKDVEPQTQ